MFGLAVLHPTGSENWRFWYIKTTWKGKENRCRKKVLLYLSVHLGDLIEQIKESVICTLTLNGYPGTVNTHPLSTLQRRNLKRMLITLTTHQMFSVHTSLEKFENATLDLCSRNSWRNRFGKAPFWKCFPSTLKHKACVFKFLGFQQCFRLESARFRGKLLWTEDLTVEMKLLKLFTGR